MKQSAQHSVFRFHHLCGSPFALVVICAFVMFASQPAPAQTYTVLHNFTGGADGGEPTAGLTLIGASNLVGGAGPSAVFRIRQAGQGWILTPIFQFDETDGEYLAGRLSVGPDGILYGATSGGGLLRCTGGYGGCGLIFSLRPMTSICASLACPWIESVLYEFADNADAHHPTGGLTFDASGNIYGTTAAGGVFDEGTVFELTPSQGGWNENILYSFGQSPSDGVIPNGNLVIDHAGKIVGTTANGGDPTCQCGVVFQLTPNGAGWSETIVHTFTLRPDGAVPSGGLVSDAAGNLYGGTRQGGASLGGDVYELTPSGGGYSFQVLYSFPSDADYQGPRGIPAIDGNGNLYETTWSQGLFGQGNVFELTPSNGSWTYTDLHDFDNPIDGMNPPDGPTLDPSGNLYGVTSQGGTDGLGLIWQITGIGSPRRN